jgi:uncharacterized protein YoxC
MQFLYLVILAISFCQNLAQEVGDGDSYTGFIQRDNSSQQSSHYYVGEAVEKVSLDLNTLGDAYTNSSQPLDTKADSTIKVSVESAEFMLQQNIDAKEEELSSLENDIKSLETQIRISESCEGIDTCNDCTLSDKCVWCSLKKECVPGDRNGPFESQCTEYEYGQCRELGCKQYERCDICIADPSCGWCEFGKVCNENGDTCDYDYFYSLKKEGFTTCPEHKADNTVKRENTYINSMKTSLENMKKEYEIAQKDLEDLKAKKEELVKKGYEYENLEVSIVDIGEAVEDVGERANERYWEESEEKKQESNEIIDSAEGYVNNSTQKIFDKYEEQIEKYLNETSVEIEESKKEIEQIYEERKELIKEDVRETGSKFLQIIEPNVNTDSTSESSQVVSFLSSGVPSHSGFLPASLSEIFEN